MIETPFTESFESIAAEIIFQNKHILVCEVYRPLNTNIVDFDDNLDSLLALCKKYDQCFICSDQNLNLIKSDVHQPTSDFLAKMLNNCFVPYILKPTRITHSSSTLIDNIYVKSKSLMKNSSYIVVDGMSDHYLCLLLYNLNVDRIKDVEIVLNKHKLKEEKMLKIQEMLLFHDWSCVLDMDVNDSYSYLISVITKALNRYAPSCSVKIRIDEKFREPWLTVKLRKYNQKCRRLCMKAKNSGLECDHIKYGQYRNILNRIKLHEKRAHYSELFIKIGKNTKLLWNVINGIMKKSNNKTKIVELLQNDILITEKTDICKIFNDHFSSAGQRVQDSISNCASSVNYKDFLKPVESKLKFPRVTEGQICRIVSKMKSKTSTGCDGISNELLKSLVSVIKQPLCIIFNKSLSSGIFLDMMKLAKVVPLFKTGDQLLCDNYRPISLLPVISKVLERIVYNTVVTHLNENGVLCHHQYGFRKHHSTSDAVLNLVGEILSSFDRDKWY